MVVEVKSKKGNVTNCACVHYRVYRRLYPRKWKGLNKCCLYICVDSTPGLVACLISKIPGTLFKIVFKLLAVLNPDLTSSSDGSQAAHFQAILLQHTQGTSYMGNYLVQIFTKPG